MSSCTSSGSKEKQSPFIQNLEERYKNIEGFLDVQEEHDVNEKELRSFVDKDKEINNKIIEMFKQVFLSE